MGQSATETLKEIDQARERLENDLAELGERMPDARTIKIAAACAGGALGLLFATRALARRKR
jgi:hypothetical protein